MTTWTAVTRNDIYIMPAPVGNLSQGTSWDDADIGQWDTCKKAIDAVKTHAEKHNLIRCYVTPELHEASVKEWERRNGRKAPEFKFIA